MCYSYNTVKKAYDSSFQFNHQFIISYRMLMTIEINFKMQKLMFDGIKHLV